MKICFGPGTWGFRNDGTRKYYDPDSPLVAYLVGLGHEVIFALDRELKPVPYIGWETNIGGIGFPQLAHLGWNLGGMNFYEFLVPSRCRDKRIKPEELIFIAHSHGMNVGLNAFAYGLQGRLISIGGPVRYDMRGVVQDAVPNIINWVSVFDSKTDLIQVAGSDLWPDLQIRRYWPDSHPMDIHFTGHTGVIENSSLYYHLGKAIELVCQ